jgi:hypothetical protein
MKASRIILIHKADEAKPTKPTKLAVSASHELLKVARVRRPGIEAFIESGQFAALAPVPQAVIDNPDRRRDEFPDAFFIIEESDMGRTPKNGRRDIDSTAQSILLWIKKFYAETPKPLVRASELSIVVEWFDIED